MKKKKRISRECCGIYILEFSSELYPLLALQPHTCFSRTKNYWLRAQVAHQAFCPNDTPNHHTQMYAFLDAQYISAHFVLDGEFWSNRSLMNPSTPIISR